MLPNIVESYLKERHPRFEHHLHDGSPMTAQDLAAAEHISGHRVAKPVVVRLGGRLALAVVAAADRVRLGVLEEATGEHAELVPETEFKDAFGPCETGAEPPLSIFDVPILADEKLLHERRLLMPGGTHRDAIMLETQEWAEAEKVQPIANLGQPLH